MFAETEKHESSQHSSEDELVESTGSPTDSISFEKDILKLLNFLPEGMQSDFQSVCN